DLLPGGRSGRALDPGVRVPDVLLGNPGRVALDLEADVALLEQHRCPVATEERVAQPGLEPVPARGERAGHIAHVLVVHQQEGAEVVGLHPLAGALQPVAAEAIPVDALLPVDAHGAEIGHWLSSWVRDRDRTAAALTGYSVSFPSEVKPP